MEKTVSYTDPSLCDVCRTVDITKHLDDGAPYPGPSELGPFQEILNKEEHCPLCRLVIRALSVHARKYWKPGEYPVEMCFMGRWGDTRRPRLDVWFDATTATFPDGVSGHHTVLGSILPLAPDSNVDAQGRASERELEYGRRINPQFDASLVRRWMDDCSRRHGAKCNPVEQHNDYIGLLLIDVQRMCLASTDWSVKYVALSYVWGQAKQFKTLCENLFELREEGSLRTVHAQLPRLIQDAIAFVAAIGERYLWVDALCIVQDDALSKALCLPRMGLIYGRAVLTLVALSGEDADAPLPGLADGTRRPSAAPLEVRDMQFVVKGQALGFLQQFTTWHTRAWTFQEAMLSRRRLYLSDTQMYWQCPTSYCSEDSTRQSADDGPMRQGGTSPLERDVSSESDLRMQFNVYESLVKGYSWRAMTYPSDSVNAFMGVMQQLSLRFDWSFVSALPESVFERGLLWSSMMDSCKLRPRAFPVPENSTPSPSPCKSPTWCWSAWTGHVFWDPWRLDAYAGKRISIKSEVSSGFILNDEGIRTLNTRDGEPCLVNEQIRSRGDAFSATALKIIRDMNDSGPGSSTTALIFEAATHDLGEEYSLGPPGDNRAPVGSPGYFSNALSSSLWIYDKDKRHCGSIRGLSTWEPDTTDEWISYGLVLFSRSEQDEVTDQDVEAWRDRLSLEYPSSTEYYEEIYDTSSYRFKKDWSCNVMLVRWLGQDGYAQRLAVGQMHADAWDDGTMKDKCVILI